MNGWALRVDLHAESDCSLVDEWQLVESVVMKHKNEMGHAGCCSIFVLFLRLYRGRGGVLL